MRHADRPSGPGNPLKERREAVTEQEEIDELEAETQPTIPLADDPGASARHADRNAHRGAGRTALAAAPPEKLETPVQGEPADEPSMPRTWVLVADEGIARIYERPASGGDLEDVEQLTDAVAHADRADLRRDAYGRRAGGDPRMGGNVTSSASDDELHREGALFAARVAERLAEALQQKRFEALHVVAAPRFLGQLRKAFDRHVSGCIVGELAKDLIHADRRELTLRLFPPPS